ncbi:MAG: porphobilinogen synthase [Candidatus Gygaella obscura]|nr:porphobilinogen synthase [Candidatus Gygaella obscura]
MKSPRCRPRRLRNNRLLREKLKETKLNINDFVMPYFVCEGRFIKREVKSMPGVFQLSIDSLIKEVRGCLKLGLNTIILFGIPDKKDEIASRSYAADGIVQKAVRALKERFKNLLIISDVCVCAYTSHGHCGMVVKKNNKFYVDNDSSLDVLAKMALSHAQAGVDIVAPSSMMDSQVKAIRNCLDKNGFIDLPIMAYSAKFASSFYGPFRDAALSSPKFGDRKSYQMDFSNSKEALKEVSLDIKEGADIVMVKPALAYQDIIYRVKQLINLPLAIYSVSGEYSMIKQASIKKLFEEKQIVMEMMTGFKRSGADIIITYFAKDIARWLK